MLTGIPAAVRVRLAKKGMGDILKHRIAWTLGYIFVGNGANGAANAILFETNTSTFIASFVGSVPTLIPILAGDTNLGKTYISDIAKHYARKVIHRMWCHVDALVPSTGSAMMAAIGFARGPSACANTVFQPLATVAATGTPLDTVTSMADCLVLTSFENRSLEITHLIAGGSGPRQNEFNISGQNNVATVCSAGATVGAQVPGGLEGIVPACLIVGGNNTIAAYQNTQMFEVVIEQEVSFIDYTGGMVNANPLP